MQFTTSSEDRIAEACREFGGKASELVDVCERLDDMISDRDAIIGTLESEIAELKEAQS